MESIESLLQKPEGKTLEFKRDLSSPSPIIKTLVAFANTAGGRLIIGYENQQIVGVEDPFLEEERICNIIADSITPRLIPDIEIFTVNNRTLLSVHVYLGCGRPHWIKSQGIENGVYVRLGSTNRLADKQLVEELRRSAEGKAFDEMPMPELEINDLDMESARKIFHGLNSLDEQAMFTLRLLVKDQGRSVPTKGAVLLFGKDREQHFPDVWIQCGRFVGKDKADIFDHTELHDHLPQAVESIMLFLKKHAMRGADFSKTRRKDVWSIPLGMLREIVINALVHTDYSQRGAPIRVAFFDDRIEIENPGILLPGLTIEDIKQGISKIRNPVIARVFRELGLIEQWGSGVRRIFNEADQLGLPNPVIEEIGMKIRFTVFLARNVLVAKTSKSRLKSNQKKTTQSPTQSPTQSHSSVVRILQSLGQGPLSSGEIRQKLGLKHRATFRNNYLHPALEQGLIEMTIPEKPSSRLQKYQLTKQGKKFLERE